MYKKVAIVLLVLWLLGSIYNVGGSYIHVLFMGAVAAMILSLVTPPVTR
jgi:hypothetical protein